MRAFALTLSLSPLLLLSRPSLLPHFSICQDYYWWYFKYVKSCYDVLEFLSQSVKIPTDYISNIFSEAILLLPLQLKTNNIRINNNLKSSSTIVLILNPLSVELLIDPYRNGYKRRYGSINISDNYSFKQLQRFEF